MHDLWIIRDISFFLNDSQDDGYVVVENLDDKQLKTLSNILIAQGISILITNSK